MTAYPHNSPSLSEPRLVLVSPSESDRDLQNQLISPAGNDKVHPIENLEALVTTRLGGDDANKRCFALIEDQPDGGRNILAAIYTYWSAPEPAEQPWAVLPGRVDKILAEPSRPLDEDPAVVAFYSISAFARGAGKLLIKSLHSAFTQAANPPILTTLSPLRTLGAWLDQTGKSLEGSLESRLQTVASYLGLMQDPVQKFHLGNGAQIGAIHFNANAAGTLDDTLGAGCMISYRYPRDPARLLENKALLKAGAIPASRHLADLFLSDDNLPSTPMPQRLG